MKAITKTTTTIDHEIQRAERKKAKYDYPEVVFSFDAHWSGDVPRSIATDGAGGWFLCDAHLDDKVPRAEMTEVSVAEACRWYVDCNRFANGASGDIAPLLADVAKALEKIS